MARRGRGEEEATREGGGGKCYPEVALVAVRASAEGDLGRPISDHTAA